MDEINAYIGCPKIMPPILAKLFRALKTILYIQRFFRQLRQHTLRWLLTVGADHKATSTSLQSLDPLETYLHSTLRRATDLQRRPQKPLFRQLPVAFLVATVPSL